MNNFNIWSTLAFISPVHKGGVEVPLDPHQYLENTLGLENRGGQIFAKGGTDLLARVNTSLTACVKARLSGLGATTQRFELIVASSARSKINVYTIFVRPWDPREHRRHISLKALPLNSGARLGKLVETSLSDSPSIESVQSALVYLVCGRMSYQARVEARS